MFIFKESTSRVDHDAKCLNRNRSHRANVLLFHDVLSMSRLFLKKAIRNSRRGDYGGNFRQRDERNRLLFTTRIETILFRMIKKPACIFISQRVIYSSVIFEQSKHEW